MKCFHLQADVRGLQPTLANASEIICHGALPPEPAPGTRQRTVGTRRNHLGMYQLFWAEGAGGGHTGIRYGDCVDAPPLIIDGKEVPGSREFPRQMRERMAALLGESPQVVAYLLFDSPPAEIEPRPYYVEPQ